jgi:ADP-heptose:LPS heptosyltransferase
LQILKRARPDVRLAVVVEDRFRAVFEGNPDVDGILPPELGALRRWRPRLCLNLHGGTRSAWMTALSGARLRAGFAHFRHGAVYNVRIPRVQEILGVERKVHTAEHLASAMFYLGAPVCEIPRARLAADGNWDQARDQGVGVPSGRAQRAPQGAPRGRPPHFAVLHPVAATPEKTWPAAGFLEVARQLRQSGLELVFIGGPADDLSPFHEFRTLGGAPLGEIKNLLAGASLFIGNDSGPAHMAAAFGLPVVVVFGASDPEIWGPWRTASEIVAAPGGIAQVQPAQVIEALARLRVAA